MVEVTSPKETLHVLFEASPTSESPRARVPLPLLQVLGYCELYMKIKRERPHLGTDEEKRFCQDGLICFTELNFSITSL